jgi:heme/copper-type cytochrome/quinol oxidase subunit 2
VKLLRRPLTLPIVSLFCVLFITSTARAADWSSWWLPDNHSVHGRDVDTLFYWIFWITMVAWILVQTTMIVFMIKYRRRPGVKKGFFIHGNTRLEMVWTLVPAVILAAIALASKQVWTDYKFGYEMRPSNVVPARIMVVGEQFKWNVIYPGPDGQFGKYLLFPRPTDAKWPDGKKYQGFDGPRDVPPDQVDSVISRFIDANKLGKDMNDPKGKDDDYLNAYDRTLEVPIDRPVDVYLTSKDVIHSFSIPNFRTKLDAVPGLLGVVSFTPHGDQTLASDREKSFVKTYTLDQIEELLKSPATREQHIVLTEADAAQGAIKDGNIWKYAVDKKVRGRTVKSTIIANGDVFNYDPADATADTVALLRKMGVKNVTAYRPGYFDLVCQELCGSGHYKMQNRVKVITNQEYAQKFEGAGSPSPAPAGATTRPVALAR